MATATDEAILTEGNTRCAIVVTLDSDFHALLALSNASSPSVIRIRIQGLKGKGVAQIIQQGRLRQGQALCSVFNRTKRPRKRAQPASVSSFSRGRADVAIKPRSPRPRNLLAL